MKENPTDIMYHHHVELDKNTDSHLDSNTDIVTVKANKAKIPINLCDQCNQKSAILHTPGNR